jgi:hypothetical protein
MNKTQIADEESEYKNVSPIITNMNEIFKVPIYYNSKKVEIKSNIITDLELITPIEKSCNPIYTYFFNTENDVSTKISEQITNFYTTDISFLEDTQKLMKEYKPLENKYTNISPNYKNIIDIWDELKVDTGFKDKYSYVDWEMFEFLNNSEMFLQLMSTYNVLSPLFSLIMPIFILIIPFFIIKLKGLNLTVEEYVEVLKLVAQTNAVGKLFTSNFSTMKPQDAIYIIISAAFYVFSIYQNIISCIKFYNNMKTIHTYFNDIKLYLNTTIHSMENYTQFSKHLKTHDEFNSTIQTKMKILHEINKKLNSIAEYNLYNINNYKEIGNVLKYFYELHSSAVYEDAIMYSIGFNGYIDCIEGLQKNILERKVNYAKFQKKTKKEKGKKDDDKKDLKKDSRHKENIFKNSYYANLMNKNPIKNTITFEKNQIITGPNASGKTTILKSTLINIILTQQFGCGFYDSAKFVPFKHIHCYLNIPDTSGRDSLFQAEARRCKEILDVINEHKNESHFCVFDEIYSGTNPEEAENSATAFMLYLQKYKNVSSMLTTHFINVCKNLNKIKTIQNNRMASEKKDNKITYLYKLEPGISEIRGGINVLTEMNYPKEILEHNNVTNN